MCWMPWTTYAPATASALCEGAISTHGCEGRTSVVNSRPSAISTRTSTSVIVPWSPGNSTRRPASPRAPKAIERRSRSESVRSCTVGAVRSRAPSGSFRTTGRRMPDSTGVRHRRSQRPGSVSLISRKAGRTSCAHAPGTNDASRTNTNIAGFMQSRRSLRGDARQGTAVHRWQCREVHFAQVLRKNDLVASSHRVVRPLSDRGALVFDPSRLDVRLDLFEGRYARRRCRVDPHEMPAVTGLDRPCPGAGRHLEQRPGEGRPERLGHVVERAIAVVVLEHERISGRRRLRRVPGLAGNLLEHPRRVVSYPRPSAVGREVELTERGACELREPLRILGEPRPELVGRGLAQRRHVLEEEFHLLRHPALDDRVVL